ncbi:DHHW family protein [Gottfriedia sp. OAE603]|uniref:DHHW family protein n=1 Tax=Gottfriedia sp. OAE603 TaxID=2663872 RepID=UPI00178B0E94
MKHSKLNFSNIIISLFFFGILFGSFFLTMVLPDRKVSVIENRSLATKPVLTGESFKSGKYFDEYETYHSDQYPLRNKMLEINGLFKYKMIDQKIAEIGPKKYYRSNNGFIIQQNSNQNPTTLVNELKGLTSELSKKNIPVFYSIIPHKSVFFETELPTYLPSYGKESVKKLRDGLESVPSLHLIDVEKELRKQPKEEIYFKTDHHWNTKGAFIGYQKIVSELNKTLPEIGDPISKDTFKFEKKGLAFNGSYARSTTLSFVTESDQMIVPTNDIISPTVKACIDKDNKCDDPVFFPEKLTEVNPYTDRFVYFGLNQALIRYKNSDPISQKKLVILKDSYAKPIIPFLTKHFKEVDVLDTRYFGEDANFKNSSAVKFIEEEKPDAVIFITNTTAVEKNITEYIQ